MNTNEPRTDGSTALVVTGHGERWITVAPGLTWVEAVAYAAPMLAAGERVTGAVRYR